MVVEMVETSEALRSLVTSNRTVVLDFWASWCGPCHAMASIFEKIATKHADLAKFAKINVEKLPNLARIGTVAYLPTFVVLKDGKEVGRLVGAPPQRQLEREILNLAESTRRKMRGSGTQS